MRMFARRSSGIAMVTERYIEFSILMWRHSANAHTQGDRRKKRHTQNDHGGEEKRCANHENTATFDVDPIESEGNEEHIEKRRNREREREQVFWLLLRLCLFLIFNAHDTVLNTKFVLLAPYRFGLCVCVSRA